MEGVLRCPRGVRNTERECSVVNTNAVDTLRHLSQSLPEDVITPGRSLPNKILETLPHASRESCCETLKGG